MLASKSGFSIVILTAALGVASAAAARDQIRIVGSSTVFPFSTSIAEQFGKSTDFKTPVVESTGSGGGFKLFCAGVGLDTPDITNASRRMKMKEFKKCAAAGVTAITETVVGFDGIVVANSIDAPDLAVTRAQLWQALAQAGARPPLWSDVDPSFPVEKIEVLGPPPSSGTRDAFEELVMQKGCVESGHDRKFCKSDGTELRTDGAYIEAGENDNLIVSKLEKNPSAFGIFGFSYLDQNSDRIKGAFVNDVDPTFDAIADGSYPISRKLYFYIKNAHVGVVPGIAEFANMFVSDAQIGADGAQIDKGLIPLPDTDHAAMKDHVKNLVVMTGNEGLE